MNRVPDLKDLSLSEIKRRLSGMNRPDPALLELLRNDGRPGAVRLYRRLLRRLTQQREETDRLRTLYGYERALEAAGCGPVAGVDEAGRGPLAGPVVAAAVILPGRAVIAELNDSKLLTGSARTRIAGTIMAQARAWGIGLADVEEIERFNILQASLLAMRRALAVLSVKPGWVLVDGPFVVPGNAGGQTPLVGGDGASATVAAASILAKVYRDNLMERAHHQYPQYGFNRHKGYPTAEHYRALRLLGPCPLHRFTFLRNFSSGSPNTRLFQEP
ncbi:MAG: ribonuclease HII [Candidatus Desulforudis sp.]|nr:ribonuclease HII [Desulforudis sp.]